MFLPFEENVTDGLLLQVGISQRMIDFAHSTTQSMIDAAAEVTPAFGRGEVIDVNGSPVELLLVKNPMGFRLSLASFTPEGCDTMIAINDEYADGRDMSWLWDVDFSSLRALVWPWFQACAHGIWRCASNTIRCGEQRQHGT